MMLPTARAAPGRPATAATSPYVATRPGGMRRTVARTREVKSVTKAPGAESVCARVSEPDAQSCAHLRTADVDGDGPVLGGIEIDCRAAEARHRAGADMPREHPAHVRTGVEAGLRSLLAGRVHA